MRVFSDREMEIIEQFHDCMGWDLLRTDLIKSIKEVNSDEFIIEWTNPTVDLTTEYRFFPKTNTVK